MPGNQARSRARSAATRGPARVPRAPKALVPRQRLYRNLDTATESPLTLIVGPAGTGKTVLLSSWLEQASTQVGRVRWKSAHDGVDVAEILLLAAGVESRRAHTLLADSPPGDSMPAVLDELRNCAEGDNPPDLVVVDDAHLLGSREIGLLSAVLSSGPDSVRLLLASRRDLPLPILELQLHGHASVIRAGELRFDEQESESWSGTTSTPPPPMPSISSGRVPTAGPLPWCSEPGRWRPWTGPTRRVRPSVGPRSRSSTSFSARPSTVWSNPSASCS